MPSWISTTEGVGGRKQPKCTRESINTNMPFTATLIASLNTQFYVITQIVFSIWTKPDVFTRKHIVQRTYFGAYSSNIFIRKVKWAAWTGQRHSVTNSYKSIYQIEELRTSLTSCSVIILSMQECISTVIDITIHIAGIAGLLNLCWWRGA